MTPNTIGKLLKTIDPAEMLQHSVINHHVDGLDYLCLHITKDITIKLYVMEEPRNANGIYLFNPHSHRHSFSSVVINGEFEHVRFTKTAGDDWLEYQYTPETGVTVLQGQCSLLPHTRTHGYHSDYWCTSTDIHSLRLKPQSGPFVLGVTQLKKEREYSMLYLRPENKGVLTHAHSRTPTLEDMKDLMQRAAFYVDRHFNVYDRLRPELYGYRVRQLYKAP